MKRESNGKSELSRRELLAKAGLGIFAALALTGCDEDNRQPEEKLHAPHPDFNSRQVMPCPKCGNPTAPYRISEIKSWYKCAGNPPKFAYHETREWTHTLKFDEDHHER